MKSVFILIFILVSEVTIADTIKVAVASNFVTTLKKIQIQFERNTNHKLKLISGSSGKLFSMIKNGAPFDLFLSADEEKTTELIKEELGIRKSEYTYANGKLVLWNNSDSNLDVKNLLNNHKKISKIAIANPKHAPYGKAAIQSLKSLGLYLEYSSKMIIGENVSLAFNYIKSKNVEVGFVPLSLIKLANIKPNKYWEIPAKYYKPIKQNLVILKRTKYLKTVKFFIEYLKLSSTKELISSLGYGGHR